MLDDHVPFMRAGIPAVDLIDFEFGSAPGLNDFWHTEKDTLDKIEARSLEIVGATLRLIRLFRIKLLVIDSARSLLYIDGVARCESFDMEDKFQST